MDSRSVRVISVPVALYLASGLTIIISVLRLFEIATSTVPADSLRLMAAPISHAAHVAAGAAFGIIGPIQFSRVLMRKFGAAHRILGRVFVASGAVLSLSSLTLLWNFPDTHAPIVTIGRLVFGLALGVALFVAMRKIKARDIPAHRNWMIRSYAVGMGATIVSLIFIPIYITTGVPPTGMLADVLFIGSWAACVVFAEALIRRLHQKGNHQ